MDFRKLIIKAIKNEKFNITRHSWKEMKDDDLELKEVFRTTFSGKVIEDYPKDLPFPSFLVYGENEKSEPVHSVWAYDNKIAVAVLITVYRPDPAKWIKFAKRR